MTLITALVPPAARLSTAQLVDAADHPLFINRELSSLAFNERVLEEAKDAARPLVERLKFLAIVSTNLDEFFMVRVTGLKQQILGKVVETPADGMPAAEALTAISERVHRILVEQDRVYLTELLPGLREAGLHILQPESFTTEQQEAARRHFQARIFAALTPLAVDPEHPFPHLRNKSINIAVVLRRQGRRRQKAQKGSLFAVVQLPSVLGRLVPLPADPAVGGQCFALLGDVIAHNVADLFPGFEVRQTSRFRVTRNSDLLVDEEDSEDLLSTIQEELRRRDLGAAVRLELGDNTSAEVESFLRQALHLDAADVYRAQSPLQLNDLVQLNDFVKKPELRFEPLTPVTPAALRDAASVVQVVSTRDVLLHHPYESFDPVVRFIEEAAEDPDVLAIKQTLYRTSGDSPFVQALSRAAHNGKQATAVVELKARFDEANNIAWARRLEENGVHVVFGLMGLKTHCKMALVVRREGDGIRRYVHIGTGNYNPTTARLYTDISLLTARPEIAEDASLLFNLLTGYADAPQWKRLGVAPFDLQQRIVSLIEREAERAKGAKPARIVAKMNSLVDPVVIKALYAASQAGVEIDLLVRGICCLKPGLPGISDRIRVTSIVDRFLEHSRVFAFGADPEVFIASADWMPRNFLRRVELMCPVEEAGLKKRLLDELHVALGDNVSARDLHVDGTYVRRKPGSPSDERVHYQQILADRARSRADAPTALP